MPLNIGIGGTRRVANDLKVGVNGQARRIRKIFVGINGQAREVYNSENPFFNVNSSFRCDVRVDSAAIANNAVGANDIRNFVMDTLFNNRVAQGIGSLSTAPAAGASMAVGVMPPRNPFIQFRANRFIDRRQITGPAGLRWYRISGVTQSVGGSTFDTGLATANTEVALDRFPTQTSHYGFNMLQISFNVDQMVNERYLCINVVTSTT